MFLIILVAVSYVLIDLVDPGNVVDASPEVASYALIDPGNVVDASLEVASYALIDPGNVVDASRLGTECQTDLVWHVSTSEVQPLALAVEGVLAAGVCGFAGFWDSSGCCTDSLAKIEDGSSGISGKRISPDYSSHVAEDRSIPSGAGGVIEGANSSLLWLALATLPILGLVPSGSFGRKLARSRLRQEQSMQEFKTTTSQLVFGALVKALRIKHGMTQGEVARATDWHQSHISDIEAGLTLLTNREDVSTLAGILEASPDETIAMFLALKLVPSGEVASKLSDMLNETENEFLAVVVDKILTGLIEEGNGHKSKTKHQSHNSS